VACIVRIGFVHRTLDKSTLAHMVFPHPGGPCSKTPLGAVSRSDCANSSRF
jgi:hypothetical protein